MPKSRELAILTILICITSTSSLGAHLFSFDKKWSSNICAKNYPAGATVTEDYSNVEHLTMNTQINSSIYGSGCSSDQLPNGHSAVLGASLNSNLTGTAHLAWESVDPAPNGLGRHALISRSIDDLSGTFSVERFIQLWPNSTAGETSIDWMPCA